jgi:DHA1 family tetracycline resistance protein-like MFS transporter
MPLYLLIFIAFTGYAMMVTLFIPMLMHNTGFLDESVQRSTRVIYGGILLALYPLGQFLGSPVIGSISDRYGRKRVLLISIILTILFYLVIAYSLEIRSLWILMGACFLAGLTESNVAICQSAIADISPPDDRGRLFAYLYSCMSLGYIIGPLIGGQLAVHYGYSTPFRVVIVLLVITYFWILRGFHDAFIPNRGEPADYLKTFTNLATVLTDVPIRRVYLVNFLIYLSMFGFFRVVQMYMVDKWNFRVGDVTFYYSYLAVMAGIANTFVFAPLSRRFTLKSITIWTGILSGLLIVSIVIPNAEVSYWFTAGPASFIGVLAIAACGTYLSTLVSAERQGRVLGNNLALQVGAESLSAFLGGFLAAVLIPLPLITYGVAAILGGLLLITYKKPDAPD